MTTNTAATIHTGFDHARFNMIEQQIRPWEVLDRQVLELLAELQRQQLVEARDGGFWVNPGNQMRLLLLAEEMVLQGGTAQFDLTLETLETDAGINASFIYAGELFEVATVEQLADHWRNLLQGMLEPQLALGELPMYMFKLMDTCAR